MNWFETLKRSLKDMRADFSALIDDKIKNINSNHIDSYEFENLVKDVPQSISFAEEIPEVNVIPVAFEYKEGLKNQEKVLEDYSVDNDIIRMNDTTKCSTDGIKLKDEYVHMLIDIVAINNPSPEDGFYTTDIKEYINIDRIEVTKSLWL